MCEPVSIIGSLVSAGAAGAGTVAQANAAGRAGKAEAAQAAANAGYAYEAELGALRKGERDAATVKTAGSQIRAKAKVGFAKSGVDVQSGTALDAYSAVDRFSELDAETIRNNAAIDARGFRTQGLNYGQQAAATRAATDATVAGTIIGGVGSVFGGLASGYAATKRGAAK